MSFAKHPRRGPDRRRKTLDLHATERRRSRTHISGVVTGIVSVLLAVIVGIAFGQALGNDFVGYDDQSYVVLNPRVTNGLTLDGIQWAFTHVHATNWHPLTTISHMLDCQLYGLEPWGHHLTNILLHAAAAILLFFALRDLTGNLWPSALVAAIFAVHPLRVESVAWVSERKDVLSGVFFMLILGVYARYARGNSARSLWYITVLILLAFGLMCKPTLVTVPFVLLLLDYWPLGRSQSVFVPRSWDCDGNMVLAGLRKASPVCALSCLLRSYASSAEDKPWTQALNRRSESALVMLWSLTLFTWVR